MTNNRLTTDASAGRFPEPAAPDAAPPAVAEPVQLPVIQPQLPGGHRGGIRVVRDHQQRRTQLAVQLSQQAQNFRAAVSSSRSPVGSSATTTLGCAMIARAIPTRCSCPPDNCRG